MKQSMEKSNFYQERDNAVYDTYLKTMRETKDTFDTDDIIRRVAVSPQPRIWVPARTVYNILRRHIKHHHPSNTPLMGSPTSRAIPSGSPEGHPHLSPLARDVIAAYYRLKDRREFRGKSLYFIADFVTAEPSHGFYLSHRRLFDIIRTRRKQNFTKRCSLAISSLQSYERHTLLYGLKP